MTVSLMKPLAIFILVGFFFVTGCSSIYRLEIPPDIVESELENEAFSQVDEFWNKNGFEPKTNYCSLFTPARSAEVEQILRGCWIKSYPGFLFPYSGHIDVIEVSENGSSIIYIYSTGRESEAKDYTNDLRKYLSEKNSNIEVKFTTKYFLDFR